MISRRVLCASVALFLAGSCVAAHADLIGSSVTVSGACCTASTDVTSTEGPVIVGPGVEFPAGSILYYEEQIDVSGSQIAITTIASSEPYGPGTFNGFVLNFTGAPTFSSVTLDPSSTLDPVDFSFTSNSVTVNFAGLSTAPGITTVLDVHTAATPEPSSIALLGTGLLGFAGVIRRRLTA